MSHLQSLKNNWKPNYFLMCESVQCNTPPPFKCIKIRFCLILTFSLWYISLKSFLLWLVHWGNNKRVKHRPFYGPYSHKGPRVDTVIKHICLISNVSEERFKRVLSHEQPRIACNTPLDWINSSLRWCVLTTYKPRAQIWGNSCISN